MKSDVYSLRLEPELRSSLARAARERGVSVAAILDEAAREWLARRQDDGDEQARLRSALAAVVGSIAGGDPDRASEASRRVRAELVARHPKRGR